MTSQQQFYCLTFKLQFLTAIKIFDKHYRPVGKVEGQEGKRYNQLCHSFNLKEKVDKKDRTKIRREIYKNQLRIDKFGLVVTFASESANFQTHM